MNLLTCIKSKYLISVALTHFKVTADHSIKNWKTDLMYIQFYTNV